LLAAWSWSLSGCCLLPARDRSSRRSVLSRTTRAIMRMSLAGLRGRRWAVKLG